MLVYATYQDLVSGSWLKPDSELTEELAVGKIRQASARVRHATRGARYDAGSNGLPTDSELVMAMRDATCAQVAHWDETGIDPVTSVTRARVASKSMGGRSVSYRDDTAIVVGVANELCVEAVRILTDVGLVGQPQAW